MKSPIRPQTAITLLAIVASLQAASPSFDAWADGLAADWVRANPQIATRTQYLSGAEQDALDRQLTLDSAFGLVRGVTGAQAKAALARHGLVELRRYSLSTLTPQQRTSFAVIQWSLEDALAEAEFARHSLIFVQIFGLHLELVNFLTTVHPIRNRRDAQNYLARLALVAPRIDEGITEAEAAAAAGIIPPRFVLQRVADQLAGFTGLKPAENVLVTTFGTRLAKVGVPEAERGALVAAAEKEVRESVLAAYGRVRAMVDQQISRAKDDAGLWRLPQGQAAYAHALAHYTTTSMTAAEIHALGLREVRRIEAEMDALLKQLGYQDGSVKERYERFNANVPLPAGPDARIALIAEITLVIQDAHRRSSAIFDLMPTAPVEVEREPVFSEKSAAAHYSPPAPDGSLPGIYWVPLADLSPNCPWLRAPLKSTAYHEAIPGHHFQLTIRQESKDLPRYRKLGVFGFNSAYAEGWGLYAERLADENGWYEGDPVGRLGYLNQQLFRARRLVVDTGLHSERWTAQQAIDYGMPAQETERYVVLPGQACAYMIGQLRIIELRQKAKVALGSNFSIKGFHNLILRCGTVPLDVLAQEVGAWAAAAKTEEPALKALVHSANLVAQGIAAN